MGKTTGIEWATSTWNPWTGCTKISPGCKNCYMFRDKKRFDQDPTIIKQCSPATFNAPLKYKSPEVIFTCSWSDFFHEAADAWRAAAWDIIRKTPHHTYLILTKRPERIYQNLPADWGPNGYPNVALGVSVETQQWVSRINELFRSPARLYFVSAEPLLGPLNLILWLMKMGREFNRSPEGQRKIGWVIAGGESGPKARPAEMSWFRDLRNQCAEAGVPYFLKQLGGHPNPMDHGNALLDGVRHTAMPKWDR